MGPDTTTSTAGTNAWKPLWLFRRPSTFPTGSTTMPESEPRIDQEASQVIKRIETQMSAEGRLDKAHAAEGAGYLLAPLVLGAAGLVAWVLKSLGLEGAGMILVAVPILIGLGFLGFYLAHRK